jgi:TRAP-type C4-dicarboxylate transport system permease small subunit
LRERGHIRMTFLHKVVVGRPRVTWIWLLLVGFCFCLVLTYFTGLFFWDSVVTGSRSMQISRTYLAIPQAFLPLGALLISAVFGRDFKSILVCAETRTASVLMEEAGDQGR